MLTRLEERKRRGELYERYDKKGVRAEEEVVDKLLSPTRWQRDATLLRGLRISF